MTGVVETETATVSTLSGSSALADIPHCGQKRLVSANGVEQTEQLGMVI